MGNEAAEHSGEIIHYLAQEVAPGFVVHMQTMYMTWITMAVVFALFFMASRNPKLFLAVCKTLWNSSSISLMV